MLVDGMKPDIIRVYNGRVVYLEEWCLCNGDPGITLEVTYREQEGFVVTNIDIDHGGSEQGKGATIQEAARGAFGQHIPARLIQLFELTNPTEEQIRDIHYSKGDRLKVEWLE